SDSVGGSGPKTARNRAVGRSNIRAMHRSIIGTKPKLLLYHGWLVVAAAFLIALYGFGIGFYGPGIYLVALNELHGWPTSELSSAITTYYVLGAPTRHHSAAQHRLPRH